ncbi:MAG: DEAD/DEAH box helicase [Chloroflexota bacterium]|nr:MAG: DEAD/DEAH box helicase [Chloroflexota bacterium]
MTIEFTGMGLHPELVQAITELGYTDPTPVQAAVIPLMLAGCDVTGQAQTGTGKTAAFSLPILHNLIPGQEYIQCLVMVPTRELAIQVAEAMDDYGRYHHVRVLPVYGGQPYYRQTSRLKRGIDVVVGTPGRLLDLVRQNALDLSGVTTVVLDEADEMLSMGFIEDIEAILAVTPPARQTALFSATLPAAIRRLAERYMRAPEAVTIQREQVTVAAIEQRYYLVNEADKLAALTRLFEVEPVTSALIFVRTRAGTADLANELVRRGFPAEVLNGDLTQETRERVLNRFRQNQVKVLVATDVAARGLDIEDISHVFNYHLPEDEEIYVHRVGRTGRAGKTGIAISLVSPGEQWRLRKIEAFARSKIARTNLPTEEDIKNHREAQLLNKMEVWLKRARYQRERELVAQLVESGHDPMEIAAAALRIIRAEEKQNPVAPVAEVQEIRPDSAQRGNKYRSRRNGAPGDRGSHEEGMVRLTLSKGRSHGVRPNDVVSTIAHNAAIPGYTIGKIHIHEQHTLVDVPKEYVSQVLAKTGDYRIHKQPVAVELA